MTRDLQCEVCGLLGDRWVDIERESGMNLRFWVCPTDALWLVEPPGIDVLPGRFYEVNRNIHGQAVSLTKYLIR